MAFLSAILHMIITRNITHLIIQLTTYKDTVVVFASVHNCFPFGLLLCHSRSKDVVEPLIKPQWYVDCTEMAKEAVKVSNKYFVHFYITC